MIRLCASQIGKETGEHTAYSNGMFISSCHRWQAC